MRNLSRRVANLVDGAGMRIEWSMRAAEQGRVADVSLTQTLSP
jgi:hypothetical protein